MKIFTLLLITLFSLFFGQKHTYIPVAHQTHATQVAANSGASVGTTECHAKQINTSDTQAYLPDPNCTPGITNPDVTQATINTTICVSGYTKTIRPTASYTNQLKLQQIQLYGYTDTNPKDYEEDHVISLELGGNPTDPKNLWPEPHPSLNEKDSVENYLHKKVCDGELTLSQAQEEITQNWYAVYQEMTK
ncbi:MAG: hypothetical protein KGJ07_07055 [Patescibacteria group bacterium]|nr:hypothetical protein [Patescibacteria group bacterium]MDE2588679.1 hypothetical protein [Patescibacteria group bacterium]